MYIYASYYYIIGKGRISGKKYIVLETLSTAVLGMYEVIQS